MTRADPDVQPHPQHRLLDFLPAVYRRSPALEFFLDAFERILFGPLAAPDDVTPESGDDERPRKTPKSVEEQIRRIPSLLDPDETPEEFLAWLAQWAAITLYWEAPNRRRLVAEMIPLYEIRGTRHCVEQTLKLYIGGAVTIEEEDLPGISLGIPGRARVGEDTRLGEDTFRFNVRVEFSPVPGTRQERFRLVALTRRVIDLAKPAYTHYRLIHNLFEEERGFVIAVRSTLGVDTVLLPRSHPPYVKGTNDDTD
ncbi:MAG: hypothetical protein C5B57_06410 [Blastocatellia bacterium]|nr:MAG: hypothetical protein C5B57_06410 [Blastocatellia bacterium]